MTLIDLILNLACLLLWLKWVDRGSTGPFSKLSLVGTLRRTETRGKKWPYLLGLLGILFIRAFFYWQVGSFSGWTPRVWFGVIPLSFRPAYFGHMLLFSLASFLAALAVFYFLLLLLSALSGHEAGADVVHTAVNRQLGRLAILHASMKLLLPWPLFIALWCLLNKIFVLLRILPPPESFAHLLEQGAVASLGIYFCWKYLIAGILLLHLLNSYIYFGMWPFWVFVDQASKKMLRSIAWLPLRLGRVDLAPVLLVVLVLALAQLGERGLIWLFQQLPF